MNILKPSVSLEEKIDGTAILLKLERAGRTCYKSEDKINIGTATEFIQGILKDGHDSVIEHAIVTMRIVCDRGVSHELVRHRIASYSQESTRYCNYSKDKFSKSITVIEPCFWQDKPDMMEKWKSSMENAERHYFELVASGASPQEARSVLPNSLKTEIVVTMNLREWRHFCKLRTSKKSHPQMREVAIQALQLLSETIPVIFDDILSLQSSGCSLSNSNDNQNEHE